MIMSELSKDEILKRAQSENKGRDFAELEAGKTTLRLPPQLRLYSEQFYVQSS